LKSLRSRLLAGMILSVALLLALFGVAVYASFRKALLAEFDGALQAAARTLAASVEVEDDEIEIEASHDAVPELRDPQLPLYFQFRTHDGELLVRSDALGDMELPSFHGPVSKPTYRNLPIGQGVRVRALGVRFMPGLDDYESLASESRKGDPEKLVTLVVARSLAGLERRLARFRWLLLTTGAATMAAALAVCFVVVGRGLRPLKALAADIEGIHEENLSQRVSEEGTPAELQPVVAKLNDLIDRLEIAFERERGFTADVAHELKTPISGLRTTLDVALSRRRPAKDLAEALRDSLDIVNLMHSMVERLLMLARLDAGRMEIETRAVDLVDIVDSCWQPLEERAGERRLTFERDLPEALGIIADPDCLVIVFSNLLENAVEYADEAGRIFMRGHRENDSAEMVITNTGWRLGQEEAPRIFDRFWRADTSRTDTGTHAGLGLALVRRIVLSLGGSIDAAVEDEGILTIRLSLPAA